MTEIESKVVGKVVQGWRDASSRKVHATLGRHADLGETPAYKLTMHAEGDKPGEGLL